MPRLWIPIVLGGWKAARVGSPYSPNSYIFRAPSLGSRAYELQKYLSYRLFHTPTLILN